MIEERVDTEYKGEINGHGEKEGLPTEYQYEFEQEMLKHVNDLKIDLERKGVDINLNNIRFDINVFKKIL